MPKTVYLASVIQDTPEMVADHYTPNAMAGNLRVGKSNIIMIILPGSLHYGASQIIPQVLQGINQSLIQNGYNLMIADLDRDETSERHILNLAFGGKVRGAIILSSKLPEAGAIHWPKRACRPSRCSST